MRHLNTFIEFINENWNAFILDEAVFTPNKGQSSVAYIIGLENAHEGTKPKLGRSGTVTFNPVAKKYGKSPYQILSMALPQYKHLSWETMNEEISKKIGLSKSQLKSLSDRMAIKFRNRVKGINDDNTIFYFDDFFNMDLESLIDYTKNYMEDIDSPIYTGRIKPLNINYQIPEVFSFLKPNEGNILRAENFSLFNYPNQVDNRLQEIKLLEDPYDSLTSSQMIRNGLYNIQLDLSNIDLVLSPKSSSNILKNFSNETSNFIKQQKKATGGNPDSFNVLSDCFLKLKWKDVEPDYEALEKVTDKDFVNQFLLDLDRIKEKYADVEFKFSDNLIPINQRYLIGKFMWLPENNINPIKNSNRILIIDDFTTNGATRRQMKKLVEEVNPNAKVISLAIFSIKQPKTQIDKN
jgi:hypothetical protein